MSSSFKPGQRVRVERNAIHWPPPGSQLRHRGKTGTIVAVNRLDGKIGVAFDNSDADRQVDADTNLHADAWFLRRELTPETNPGDDRGHIR